MFDYNSCLKKGLLRKIPKSKNKCERSLEIAKKWLDEANLIYESCAYNSTIINAYLVMFHSARAFLYLEGYREKSHFCVARFLEEKYVKTDKLDIKWIMIIDFHRDLRHEEQYNLSTNTTKEEAKKAIENAKSFLEEMNKLYLKLNKNE